MTLRLTRCAFALVVLGYCLGPTTALAADDVQKPKFSWHANAQSTSQPQLSLKKARAAIIKARALNGNATWVCSPAGFGQGSRCTRG